MSTLAPAFFISGQVLNGGTGLPGVTMTLSGATAGGTAVSLSTSTNASGNYSLSIPPSGNYTLTPSLSGYSFSPASSTFNGLTSSQTATFTASSGGGGGPVPVPPPPTACTDCGLNYADNGTGANPQTAFAPNSTNTLYTYCEFKARAR